MTHNLNNNFIGVEVPEGIGKVNRFKVNHNLLQCFNSRREWITDILLPSPDYTFCFLYPDGVTEEWARQIVESKSWYTSSFNPEVGHYQRIGRETGYRNYLDPHGSCALDTALESLRTLFQSLNIHDKTIAVCKRK